jgi:hypothetical protein
MKKKYYWIIGIVLSVIIVGFYIILSFSVWIVDGVHTTLESAKAYACKELVETYNCTSSTNSVLTKDFDSNKNGGFDSGDTLLLLCQNYYGKNTDSECKKICGCV